MSQANTLRSFNAAIVRHIRTLFLNTTDAYIRAAGVTVLCPPATMRAFRRNFSPIFMSDIMWKSTFLHPGGIFSIVPQNSSNTIFTLRISFRIESHHRVLLLSVSNLRAYLSVFGILIPNLWVMVQYLDLIFATIIFFLLSTWGTHYVSAGSSAIEHNVAYSASWTG